MEMSRLRCWIEADIIYLFGFYMLRSLFVPYYLEFCTACVLHSRVPVAQGLARSTRVGSVGASVTCLAGALVDAHTYGQFVVGVLCHLSRRITQARL